MLDLSHLSSATREQAFLDAKSRIKLVQTARWVGFDRAQLAVDELERRYHYPTCARMPCMLLYGDSGLGKTMILEKMERQHPNSYEERRGITLRPVVSVQMPPNPDERRFYTQMLEVLGAPYSVRDQIGALEGRALDLLKKIGTKLLFIDEVHHLLAGSHREQRRALNLLKFVANELKIVVVAVGTQDAFHALQTDAQVASRFEHLLIPRWTATDAFRAFIVAYGKLLPMRKASSFGEPAMIQTLISDTAERLQAPHVRSKIAALSRLPDTACETLWPSSTGWELIDRAFRSYCPYCCLGDLREQRTPYGRRGWQQSWCTLCLYHGTALVLRNPHHQRASTGWSAQTLRAETHYLAPDRYRTLKVARESSLRYVILGSLVEIERAILNALAGRSPNPLWWGPLSPTEFLSIITDLTTWSLTHFEPVRAWSLAEDLSAAEEQEGYGLIGRRRRLSAADYPPGHLMRTLQEITEPKTRGSALWVAHALMSASHIGASDRDAKLSLLERQAAYLRRAAPAARGWLANRQRQWPTEYLRRWWITDPSLADSRYDPHPSVKH